MNQTNQLETEGSYHNHGFNNDFHSESVKVHQQDRSIPTTPNPHPLDTSPSLDHAALLEQKTAHDLSQSKRKTRRVSFLKFWLLEIAASILSVASLLSLIIFLRNYNRRSRNDINLPNSLTLNGIVAAIATFNRITLMVPVGSAMSQEAWLWFASTKQKNSYQSQLRDLKSSDAASRGAVGSLVFPFVARRRWIAYLGALTTILSVPFGIFTQQLLSLQEFPVTGLDSQLRPGNIPRIETWDYQSGNPAQGLLTIPLSLKAAFYNGMLGGDVSPISANCPTGNCTWPITPSLAVCGECSSTTYNLHCNVSNCNYTMPSRSVIPLSNINYTNRGYGFGVMSGYGSKYNASLRDRIYIANFDVVGAPDEPIPNGFDNHKAQASECAMWFCVQAYNVSVQDGNQVQTVVETFSSNTSAFSLNYTDFYNFPMIPTAANAMPGTNYSVSIVGQSGFTDTLSTWFKGLGIIEQGTTMAGSDVVGAIWESSGDLDSWIKRVALSATNGLRNSTDSGASTSIYPAYFGTGYQLGVAVRWEWIILPATAVLISIIFLVVIIIQTERSKVPPWKSNPLAQLFFDVDQELKEQVAGHMDTFGGVEDAVADVKVRFGKEPGGTWIFKMA